MTQVATEPGFSTQPVQIWVALGSNWGDREAALRSAALQLRQLAEAESQDAGFLASSIWETAPVGVPFGGPFLNAVAGFQGIAEPWTWLQRLQRLEVKAGRRRTIQNAPRTLDLDLLAVGGVALRHPRLELPHPRLADRAFVLAPWAEIHPGGTLPGSDRRLSARLAELGPAGMQRRGALLAAPESLPL